MAENTTHTVPLTAHLTDGFERELLTAAARNLADHGNQLRFNNFAYAMRELVRHVLARLGPEASVAKCNWYRNETRDGKPTRRQRAIYAVQGGLSDEYIRDTLRIDTAEVHKSLVDAINNLSKYTHIEPKSFGLDDASVNSNVTDTLSAVENLFSAIQHCRNEIIRSLWEHIDQAVIHQSLRETINAIDELATHSYIDEIETEDAVITLIDHDMIHFQAKGTIYCDLQWGSNSDLRNDDGMTTNESFPFVCALYSPVDDPGDIDSDEDSLCVDTSSWRDQFDKDE
ncbi:hypothetical protein [Burkholderia stabilis]|uniref:pPIWI-associating nuclease domain-containing protein n=1 Tax=Burkholderia stabilis TaxID=95485 RepID=UPI0010120884|nr:hypothetical protein [Burkholderia stabilis]